jgi:UPF0176 protein
MCHACRRPISEEEKTSPHYVHGISCPHCYTETTPEQKARFTERQKQIALARERGELHIGVTAPPRRAKDEQTLEGE